MAALVVRNPGPVHEIVIQEGLVLKRWPILRSLMDKGVEFMAMKAPEQSASWYSVIRTLQRDQRLEEAAFMVLQAFYRDERVHSPPRAYTEQLTTQGAPLYGLSRQIHWALSTDWRMTVALELEGSHSWQLVHRIWAQDELVVQKRLSINYHDLRVHRPKVLLTWFWETVLVLAAASLLPVDDVGDLGDTLLGTLWGTARNLLRNRVASLVPSCERIHGRCASCAESESLAVKLDRCTHTVFASSAGNAFIGGEHLQQFALGARSSCFRSGVSRIPGRDIPNGHTSLTNGQALPLGTPR